MLRVAARPEPQVFDAQVRQPGRRFLARRPNPTSREWSTHDYWTRILSNLRADYGAICAYSCHWIPATDGRSVEHFRPKAQYPQEAYEWTNYRLVFGVLNGCKGTHDDVIDPFVCGDNWFAIQFTSLLVSPAEGLDAQTAERVRTTIRRVHLNDEDKCLKDRFEYLRTYCVDDAPFAFLKERAPFLAKELERQGLRERIKEMMAFPAQR